MKYMIASVNDSINAAVENLLSDRDFLSDVTFALIGFIFNPTIEEFSPQDYLRDRRRHYDEYYDEANVESRNMLELFNRCLSYLDLQWSDYSRESLDQLMRQAARFAIKEGLSYKGNDDLEESELLEESLLRFLMDRVPKVVYSQRLCTDFTAKAVVAVERDLSKLSITREFKGKKIDLSQGVISLALTDLNEYYRIDPWPLSFLSLVRIIAQFADDPLDNTWIKGFVSEEWDDYYGRYLISGGI